MNETIVNIFGFIVAILTLFIGILSAYVGWVTFSLEAKLHAKLLVVIAQQRTEILELLAAKHELLAVAVEAIAGIWDGSADKELARSRVYFIKHLARLASNDAAEVEQALMAIEGAGDEAIALLPYVERLRKLSSWPPACHRLYENILKKHREARLKVHI